MKSDLVGFGRLPLRVMQSGALLTLLQASCSGETTETSDASVDAHFDMSSEMGATEEQSTPRDVGTPEEPAIDGPVVDACVPGGERKPCGAYYTGCPTTGICYERFGFVCGCVELASDPDQHTVLKAYRDGLRSR